jgi:mono/diheme cytochrome c family protein
VSIHKPLNISIPAKDAGNDWMLYKGTAGEDLSLKWGDARPLASSPAQQSTEAGKALFQTKCASCHGGKDEAAGPPLAWITKRRDRQWLHAFTRNNAILLWRGDSYSCYLFNRYKTPMPLFKDLSESDLTSLYHYIDNASKTIDSNTVIDHKRSFDSCVANDPNCGTAAQRTGTLPPQADTATAYTPEAPVTDFYVFTVDKHGWYSVARTGGSTAVVADAFPALTDSAQPALEPLQACPCWCNESAYRRADSLGRARH